MKKKPKENIVIIGNKGELGSFLKYGLPKYSNKIILSKYARINSNLDSEILFNKIKKPVSLIICGGKTKYRCKELKDSKIHVKIARSLIAKLSNEKINYIIYLSTTAVYGEKLFHDNASEKKTPKPNTPYSESKLKAEKLLSCACKKNKIKVCILRLPIVWDLNTNASFPTPNKIFKQIEAEKKVINFPASLVPARQYLKKGSFLKVVARCLKIKAEGTFNVTPDESLSMHDFCRLIHYPHVIKIKQNFNKYPESQTYSNVKLKKALRFISFK
jgi:nucleoside-diphosphate-sugar epimerase